MNDIDALGASSGRLAAAASTPTEGKTDIYGLGKDDFFRLFLAQLRNQDPTKPMDDKDMINQLATFTQIEVLTQLKDALGSNALGEAASLIGKQVTGTDSSGETVSGRVDSLLQTTDGITLHVGDASLPLGAVISVSADDAS